MTEDDPHRITSVDELRRLYDAPSEHVLKAKLGFLDDHHIHFIRLCPIICLASGAGEQFDASPRGGRPGFVHVIDRQRVAVPDWPGNNKVETITNIVETGQCAVLFLVPRLDAFLRLNGAATVTRDPALLEALGEGGKRPKAVIRVVIREAYFHCGKALRRSHIWDPEGWPDASGFPSIGKVLADQLKVADSMSAGLDAQYQEALRTTLY